MLPEVHKLLRLYLTVPVTTSTSERLLSALKRLLTYLRATMTEKRLNNCIHHVLKEITNDLDPVQVVRNFIDVNDEGKKIFR